MKNLIQFLLLLVAASLVILHGCEEDPTPPSVETLSVSEITAESAKSGGNVTDDGGEFVLRRGGIWSKSEDPTTDENEGMTNDGEGSGEFTTEITGLTPNTTYYFRAYAINSAGTAYGEEKQFITGIEPQADFSADKTEVEEGTPVHFSDKSSGNPTEWEWSFGDGNTSTEQNPSHTYTEVGIYDVKLTVSNEHGEDIKHKIDYIEIIDEKLKWKFETDSTIVSSSAIGSDGTVYVGASDENLYAINPDGSMKWRFETGDQVFSSPAIGSDGTVYVGSNDENLYAINPDGTKKWSFETDGWLASPAIGSDGTVYVGSQDENLYAINPDGTKKWRFETGDRVRASPAIGADGTVYVGSIDENLYAINPDGTKKWSFETGDRVYSSPAIGSDGTVYVGSIDENLYAINSDGTKKWSFETDDGLASPAIGSNSTIYVGSYFKNLYAINFDGTKKWRFETGDGVSSSSSPAIGADGTVYVGSIDGFLYAIDGGNVQLANSPWPKFQNNLKNTGRQE